VVGGRTGGRGVLGREVKGRGRRLRRESGEPVSIVKLDCTR